MLPTNAEESGFPFARSLILTRTESLETEEPKRESLTRYWISSLSTEETSAARFGQLTREQWNIENGTHRQRDVLWREDHQRLKHHGRAHILASLRQLALCIHSTVARERPGHKGKRRPLSHQLLRLNRNLDTAIHLITHPH